MTLIRDLAAIVTGAGSGIGKAIAHSLGEQGAVVCLIKRPHQLQLPARPSSQCQPVLGDSARTPRVRHGLRAEVNPDGICVLSLCPGRTATPRREVLYQNQRAGYQPERLQPAGWS